MPPPVLPRGDDCERRAEGDVLRCVPNALRDARHDSTAAARNNFPFGCSEGDLVFENLYAKYYVVVSRGQLVKDIPQRENKSLRCVNN